MERELPAQLSKSDREVQESIEQAAESVKAVMAGNFLLTLLISASLNQLLNMVHTQQLIVMFPLFNVTLPANAGMFLSQMMTIAAFEVIDTKPFLNTVLALPHTDPLNSNFEAIGLESRYFIHNLGTVALAYVLFVVSVAFSTLCRLCPTRKTKYFGEMRHRELFWGSLINLTTESFSILTISCMINLRFLQWDAVNTTAMSLLTIVVMLLLLAYPFYYYWLLVKNFEILTFKEFWYKYSAFYSDLKLGNGTLVLMQPVWFLIRRFLISLMVVCLNTTVIWQIALMTMNVIVQVIILGRVAPFAHGRTNKFELFSECMVMMVMYHLICFTPFVPDLQIRFKLGYVLIAVISLHLVVSLGILAKDSYRSVRNKRRLRNAAKAHDKQRQEL